MKVAVLYRCDMGRKTFKAQKNLIGRVLILEDEAMTGEWLGHALCRCGIECEWADSLDDGMEALRNSQGYVFHAVITDIFMKDGDLGGLNLMEKATELGVPVFVITSGANLEIAKRALDSGAAALFEKPFEVQVLLDKLMEIWQEPKFLPTLLERVLEVHSLTAKEKEVCRLMIKGLSNKEIASVMKVTEKTVKFHVTSIFSKLNVQSRGELASFIFPT